MIPATVARQVREALLSYLRTTFHLRDQGFEQRLLGFLTSEEQGLFRGPYLDLRLPFRTASEDEPLPLDVHPSYAPYAHQLRAWHRLGSRDQAPQSTLITTGTGSGKTECFLYPILDHVARAVAQGQRGIKALVLYPMNALATDQAARFADEIQQHGLSVRVGLYVGGEPSAATPQGLMVDRERMRDNPPDILLTNYKMLDLLLMRPADRTLWRFNAAHTLRYLVLDELHSYDGAQGTDVACLLRRLYDRLEAAPGSVACVGTSATIGGERAKDLLSRFASDVFGQAIDHEAFIGEDRLSLSEAFPPVSGSDAIAHDPYSELRAPGAELLPRDDAQDVDAYVRHQAALWLGEALDDPLALGERLSRHTFLRRLLEALRPRGSERGPVAWRMVRERLGRADEAFAELPFEDQDRVLESFLSLVSRARRAGGRAFLDLQVQLWIKELRGLVRRLDAPEALAAAAPEALPELAFREELPAQHDAHYGAIVYCRECGQDGYGALEPEATRRIKLHSQTVGEAYLRRQPAARWLLLGAAAEAAGAQLELTPATLCPVCLDYGEGKEHCTHGQRQVKRLRAHLQNTTSETSRRFAPDCRRCGASDSLTMLGARVASLSSVTISQLFHSAYHGDVPGEARKLLAFTDSVQDASHQAGFFAARTFRFNLRTAFVSALEAHGGSLPLDQLGEATLTYWTERFVHEARRTGMVEAQAALFGEARALATFLPRDLWEAPELAQYREGFTQAADGTTAIHVAAGVRNKARKLVQARLGWEAAREFGLGVLAGRSLEATGTAAVDIDEAALERASRQLTADIVERRLVQPRASLDGQVDQADVRHMLEGVLFRMRRRGAIAHPMLQRYMRHGERYHLSKRFEPALSPFGPRSVLPRFWYSGGEHKIFDVVGKASATSWLRDWLHRSLRIETTDPGMQALIARLLEVCAREGLMLKEPCGKAEAFGIAPAALTVTTQVRRLHCDTCAQSITHPLSTAERWEHQLCTTYRCRRSRWLALDDDAARSHDYYHRVFTSGAVQRIFAAEHTGLLERETRELLEQAFRRGALPDAPNLLACTPTLEMGIDIGDLSAVMLSSVPPTAASYQQRVGRAGRKSGNALVMTMARHHPHDLHFHAQPEQMMAGEVDPPGCFLDAPQMLMRHVTAHALDRWTAEHESLPDIPRWVSSLLNDKQGGFVAHFATFHEARRIQLFERLSARFHLPEDTARKLRERVQDGEVVQRMERAFSDVRDARERLSREIQLLRKREAQLDDDPQKAVRELLLPGETIDEAVARERHEVVEARKAHERERRRLGEKHPLNVLTDAGVLPNYAFPEPGVALRADLYVRKEQAAEVESPTKPLQYDYLRPASAALREFAPFNTFYAEGHRVHIQRIDVGTRAQSLVEQFRLCPDCHYAVSATAPEAKLPTCPRCEGHGYADAGQLQEVVSFRQAWSSDELMQASAADDGDERDSERYQVVDIVHLPGHDSGNARRALTEDGPLGYEYLSSASLLSFNWGRMRDVGDERKVAGRSLSQRGFLVCQDCGMVQDPLRPPKQGQPNRHTPFCAFRRGTVKDEALRTVVLARATTSEALRWLVPASPWGLEVSEATLKALLQLVFRLRFGGRAGHLRFTQMSEPTGDERLRFVVVYDDVPGGTGFLADLWSQPDELFSMFEQAQEMLSRCACVDGCYRCLYAFQSANAIDAISRRLALTQCQALIAARTHLQPCPTLSRTRVEATGESELERKFIAALQLSLEERPDWKLTRMHWQGRVEWRISSPSYRYRLIPQRDLGLAEGVSVLCRPDYLLEPVEPMVTDAARTGRTPYALAIFCDGFAYHAQPHDACSRLGDDVDKRSAILASPRHRVWSLGWKDLEEHRTDQPFRDGLLLEIPPSIAAKGKGLLKGDLLTWQSNPITQLIEYLEDPNPARWAQRAVLALMAVAQTTGAAVLGHDDAWHALAHAVARSQGTVPGEVRVPFATLAVRGKSKQTLQARLRLWDDRNERGEEGFEASWRAFLHAANVLQFAPGGLELLDTEWIALGKAPTSERPPGSERPLHASAPPGSAWAEVRALFDDVEPLLVALEAAGCTVPESEWCEQNAHGEIIREADFFWDHERVVLRYDLQAHEREAWESQGFVAFDMDTCAERPDALIAALRSRGRA
jgi:DEAD/DEAH box helicase domain-containing protein